MPPAFDLTHEQRVQFLHRLYEDIPAVAEIIKEDILAMASTEQGSGGECPLFERN